MAAAMIFARKGEHVVGPRGEVVAIVKNDLTTHSTVSPDDFDWLGKPLPKSGDPLDAMPGFRTLPDGRPQVCINGNWVPELSTEGG